MWVLPVAGPRRRHARASASPSGAGDGGARDACIGVDASVDASGSIPTRSPRSRSSGGSCSGRWPTSSVSTMPATSTTTTTPRSSTTTRRGSRSVSRAVDEGQAELAANRRPSSPAPDRGDRRRRRRLRVGLRVRRRPQPRVAATPGNTITGDISQTARERNTQCLNEARDDPSKAVACYTSVLADAPQNVEALTYRGWIRFVERRRARDRRPAAGGAARRHLSRRARVPRHRACSTPAASPTRKPSCNGSTR